MYFWDVSTGARLLELEVVDKRSMYVAAAHKDRAGSAIVRTLDGRLQQLQVHTASHSRLLLLQLPCAAVHHTALRMPSRLLVTCRMATLFLRQAASAVVQSPLLWLAMGVCCWQQPLMGAL